MLRPRDSQRSKLYAWERAVLPNYKPGTLCPGGYGSELPLNEREAQELVDDVWVVYGTKGESPRVRIMGNRGRGTATGYQIKLARHYPTTCRIWYVLHEVTHSILDRRYGWDLAGHGPQFCALYANLLSRFAGASRRGIVESMRRARLKVDGTVPAAVASIRTA